MKANGTDEKLSHRHYRSSYLPYLRQYNKQCSVASTIQRPEIYVRCTEYTSPLYRPEKCAIYIVCPINRPERCALELYICCLNNALTVFSIQVEVHDTLPKNVLFGRPVFLPWSATNVQHSRSWRGVHHEIDLPRMDLTRRLGFKSESLKGSSHSTHLLLRPMLLIVVFAQVYHLKTNECAVSSRSVLCCCVFCCAPKHTLYVTAINYPIQTWRNIPCKVQSSDPFGTLITCFLHQFNPSFAVQYLPPEPVQYLYSASTI